MDAASILFSPDRLFSTGGQGEQVSQEADASATPSTSSNQASSNARSRQAL
jgi:hypothetical protein